MNILYIYYFWEAGMDHSIKGYLNRRSDEELLRFLETAKNDPGYSEYIEMIEEILVCRKAEEKKEQ